MIHFHDFFQDIVGVFQVPGFALPAGLDFQEIFLGEGLRAGDVKWNEGRIVSDDYFLGKLDGLLSLSRFHEHGNQ